MGIYLPLIKGWNKKASKKTHKMLNFLSGNIFTVVTFKTFFSKIFLGFFANWAVDGEHDAFHKNWLH